MMLKKRVERAMALLRERREIKQAQQQEGWMPLEKGDMLAMVLSGLIVILPVAILVLSLIALAGMVWFL